MPWLQVICNASLSIVLHFPPEIREWKTFVSGRRDSRLQERPYARGGRRAMKKHFLANKLLPRDSFKVSQTTSFKRTSRMRTICKAVSCRTHCCKIQLHLTTCMYFHALFKAYQSTRSFGPPSPLADETSEASNSQVHNVPSNLSISSMSEAHQGDESISLSLSRRLSSI